MGNKGTSQTKRVTQKFWFLNFISKPFNFRTGIAGLCFKTGCATVTLIMNNSLEERKVK
jgi:hypothetical protein